MNLIAVSIRSTSVISPKQPRMYLDCLQCQNSLHLTTLLEIERVLILKWMCLTVVCVLRYKNGEKNQFEDESLI